MLLWRWLGILLWQYYLQARCPSCHETKSIKALKALELCTYMSTSSISFITLSLFHSRLKTNLFHKSFPHRLYVPTQLPSHTLNLVLTGYVLRWHYWKWFRLLQHVTIALCPSVILVYSTKATWQEMHLGGTFMCSQVTLSQTARHWSPVTSVRLWQREFDLACPKPSNQSLNLIL